MGVDEEVGSERTQLLMHELKKSFDDSGLLRYPLDSWFAAFTTWADRRGDAVTNLPGEPLADRPIVPPSRFATLVREWLESNDGLPYGRYVQFNEDDGVTGGVARSFLLGELPVCASRVDEARLQQFVEVKRVRMSVPLRGAAYASTDGVAEFTLMAWPLTIRAVVVCALLIVAVLLVVLPPALTLLVALCIVLLSTDLLGVMWLLNERVGVVSLICLTMSLGQGVDYLAHVALAYDAAPAHDRRGARVAAALGGIAAPVLKAGVSTLVGISVLGFAESAFFRSFLVLFGSSIVIGLAHALILLPALLHVVGPMPAVKQARLLDGIAMYGAVDPASPVKSTESSPQLALSPGM